MSGRISDERLDTTQQCAQCPGQKAIACKPGETCASELGQAMKISDERLAQLIDFASWPQLHESVTPDVASALDELQQSRALVTELRALAERMRNTLGPVIDMTVRDFDAGKKFSTDYWLSEFDSLLSAHGSKPEQETSVHGSRVSE